MPTLNKKNLPDSPAFHAVSAIRRVLAGARGAIELLNKSVAVGIDAVLKDAIEGRTLETRAPYVAITFSTGAFLLSTNAGAAVKQTVNVSLYFVYYTGGPSVGPLPVDFCDLRDRHIRWNIEHLKNKNVKPYQSVGLSDADRKDDAGEIFWWWPDGDQAVVITHETPLSLFGADIPMSPGFACSRADFSFVARNHATFTGDVAAGIS